MRSYSKKPSAVLRNVARATRGIGVGTAGEANNKVFENKYFNTPFLLPSSHWLEQPEARDQGSLGDVGVKDGPPRMTQNGLEDQQTVTAHEEIKAL